MQQLPAHTLRHGVVLVLVCKRQNLALVLDDSLLPGPALLVPHLNYLPCFYQADWGSVSREIKSMNLRWE